MKKIFSEPEILIKTLNQKVIMDSVLTEWNDEWGDEWDPYGIVE